MRRFVSRVGRMAVRVSRCEVLSVIPVSVCISRAFSLKLFLALALFHALDIPVLSLALSHKHRLRVSGTFLSGAGSACAWTTG